MKLWIYIIVTLFVQELVTTNAVLLQAYQQNYNVAIITGVFILCTCAGIYLGYWAGLVVQRKFGNRSFINKIKRKVTDVDAMLGPAGTRSALIILALINFNYVNAFIASWLPIRFKDIFLYLLIGDILWYLMAWFIIIGVSTVINPLYAIYIVLAFSLLVSLLFSVIHRKLTKKNQPK